MPEQESEAPLRRSARVNVRIPVKLSGILADNKTFAEDTYVITVSKYGARLLTQQPLKVGMQVKVQPRGRRQAGLFQVVWTGRPDLLGRARSASPMSTSRTFSASHFQIRTRASAR